MHGSPNFFVQIFILIVPLTGTSRWWVQNLGKCPFFVLKKCIFIISICPKPLRQLKKSIWKDRWTNGPSCCLAVLSPHSKVFVIIWSYLQLGNTCIHMYLHIYLLSHTSLANTNTHTNMHARTRKTSVTWRKSILTEGTDWQVRWMERSIMRPVPGTLEAI